MENDKNKDIMSVEKEGYKKIPYSLRKQKELDEHIVQNTKEMKAGREAIEKNTEERVKLRSSINKFNILMIIIIVIVAIAIWRFGGTLKEINDMQFITNLKDAAYGCA